MDFVFTHHGTVLYVADDGELRHGRPSPCRAKNVHVVTHGSEARILHSENGTDHPISCGASGCWSSSGRKYGVGSAGLTVVSASGGEFGLARRSRRYLGLARQSRYLCALPDGSIKLGSPHLKEWETFEIEKIGLREEPRIAGLTMVFNEPVFLPIWERYYAGQLGYENLFLIDHGSDDGSTQNSRIPNRINLPRDRYDDVQRAEFLSGLQASLLKYYDAVLYVDADEFLVADPGRFKNIRDYCSGRLDRFATAVGLDVIHFPEIEADLDLGQPLLAQRKYVRFAAEYCKPLLTEIQLNLMPGLHSCQFPARLDPHLFLFHLKLIDRGLALRQLSRFQRVVWSKNALSKGHSHQNRLSAEEFLASQYPEMPDPGAEADQRGAFGFDVELKAFDTRPYKYQKYFGKPKVLPERFWPLIV